MNKLQLFPKLNAAFYLGHIAYKKKKKKSIRADLVPLLRPATFQRETQQPQSYNSVGERTISFHHWGCLRKWNRRVLEGQRTARRSHRLLANSLAAGFTQLET